MNRRGVDLSKVHVGTPTPCSIAIVDLIQTTERIYGEGGLLNLGRDLTDEEDKLSTKLEDRKSALEEQIKRIVREQLGVEWDILYLALA